MLSKAYTAISQAFSESPLSISTLSIGTGAAAALYGAWKMYQKLYSPIVVKHLRIFPVKSCRGMNLNHFCIRSEDDHKHIFI